MPIETYKERIKEYRINNPDCSYCLSNIKYGIVDRVPECEARQMCCWNSKKTAKKCPLYAARWE